MLEVGLVGYKQLLSQRKRNFELLAAEIAKWAESRGESVIRNARNRISLAVTLKRVGADSARELGARLYRKGVMGARVVTQSTRRDRDSDESEVPKRARWTNTKTFDDRLVFKNFGGHTEDETYGGFPYMTLAAAIGSHEAEIHQLIKRLEKVYSQVLSQNKSK